MRNTKTVLAALAIGLAAIGISIAPSATADDDPSDCQTVGGVTVCGQGDVRGEGPSATPGPVSATPGPLSGPAEGGCLTPYGTYQNCVVEGNTGRPPR